MSYTYEQKKRGIENVPASSGKAAPAERNIPNSMRLAMLESGQASPTAEDKGHRVDLPEAMRAKMESSFGMDFSKVKLYESKMLGETDAEAMAQGNEIAFAPGKLDFASMEGQARLGHELSHVASQARGEVQGNGFLQDSALEARADREGALAARGESAYGGAAAPMSSASPAAMAGPMQAKGSDKKKRRANERQLQAALDPKDDTGARIEFLKNGVNDRTDSDKASPWAVLFAEYSKMIKGMPTDGYATPEMVGRLERIVELQRDLSRMRDIADRPNEEDSD